MIRRPPRSTLSSSSAASDVYKRQGCRPRGWCTTPTTGAVCPGQALRPNRHGGLVRLDAAAADVDVHLDVAGLDQAAEGAPARLSGATRAVRSPGARRAVPPAQTASTRR